MATSEIGLLPGAGDEVSAGPPDRTVVRGRRQHTEQFRQKVIEEASRPGVTVSSVARAHDLNVGLLRRWVKDRAARERLRSHAQAARATLKATSGSAASGDRRDRVVASGVTDQAAFLAIPVARGESHPPPDIRIQFARGPTSIEINWPVSAASDCGQWLREVMR